ncbi:hypothetical protein AX17_000354 [Amanita inopinata Kibby_2008]|nr:hypothetical protein AX17_000354 [Amanita inopinata Kibby_2008]
MNAARPRHSVLSLFDPLAATDIPSTPPRINTSPDSDKENNSPPPENHLTFSAFFNRTHQQQSFPPVSLLRKRLVDIGDLTLDDASTLDMVKEEQEPLTGQVVESDTTADYCLETPIALAHPRTPLADITLGECDRMPLVCTRVDALQLDPPSPSLRAVRQEASNATVHVDQQTFLFDGIPGKTLNSTDAVMEPPSVTSEVQTPAIVICAWDSMTETSPDTQFPICEDHSRENSNSALDSSSPLPSCPTEVETEPLAESSSQAVAHSTLRPRSSNTLPLDSNRFSIDLQTSFQMHLHSDASFDLLNDKITLMEPMEPLMSDDENSDFEIGKDKLQDALARFRRDAVSPGDEPYKHDNLPPSHSETASSPVNDASSLAHKPESSLTMCMAGDKSANVLTAASKSLSPPSYKAESVSSGLTKTSPIAIPQRRLSVPFATPSRLPTIVPPPAIQALRIVKRMKVHHTATKSLGNVTSVCPSIAQEAPRAQALPVGGRKSIGSTGIAPPLIKPVRLVSPVAPPSSSAKPTASSSTRTAIAGSGPRRVPIAEGPPGTAANNPAQASIPLSNFGPRRIPMNNTISATSTITTTTSTSKLPTIGTSLKQPTRPAKSGLSGLPRPAGTATTSRLPAPAALSLVPSKIRKPSVGSKVGLVTKRMMSGE